MEHSPGQIVLGYKSRLNKFKKMKSYIFSDHNRIKLKINEKNGKYENVWKLNNMFLNDQRLTEEIKREINF
jgi:hypothetical protein